MACPCRAMTRPRQSTALMSLAPPWAARSPFLFSTYLFPKITKQEGSGGPGPSRVTLEEGRARLAQALVPPTEARTEGFHFPSWSSSHPFPVAPSSPQLARGQSSFIQLVASGNLPPPRGTQDYSLGPEYGVCCCMYWTLQLTSPHTLFGQVSWSL